MWSLSTMFQNPLVIIWIFVMISYVHGKIDIFDRAPKQQCEESRTKFLSSTDRVMRNWKVGSVKDRVYEGDMILTGTQKKRYTTEKDETGGSSPLIQEKWPSNTVTYKFGSPAPDKTKITNAMKAWSSKTCIKFVEGSSNALTIKKGEGCYAQLGYAGSKEMSVGDLCDTGVVVHLLGHVIGLVHQHSRPDRDLSLKIHHMNTEIIDLKYLNYKDYKECAYDLASVMHYDMYGLSYNGESVFLARLEGSKDGYMLSPAIGSDWSKPSDSDISLVNREYGCPAKPCGNNPPTEPACNKVVTIKTKDQETRVDFKDLIKDTTKVIKCAWKSEVAPTLKCQRAVLAVALMKDVTPHEDVKRAWFASGCRLFQIEVFDPEVEITYLYCGGQFARQSVKVFVSKLQKIYVFAKMYPSKWEGFTDSAVKNGFLKFFAITDTICTGAAYQKC